MKIERLSNTIIVYKSILLFLFIGAILLFIKTLFDFFLYFSIIFFLLFLFQSTYFFQLSLNELIIQRKTLVNLITIKTIIVKKEEIKKIEFEEGKIDWVSSILFALSPQKNNDRLIITTNNDVIIVKGSFSKKSIIRIYNFCNIGLPKNFNPPK